ncbi:MAG: helix-turn-helix domain-containing protein [Pirellulaceae bacterium]
MAKKSVRRSQRTLTDEEKARMRGLREQVETEEEEIRRHGREVFARHEQAVAQTIGDLKRARQSQGLSLQEVAERMGTDRSNVHRLEQGSGNPTVATLTRYAEAIGRRIVITLEPSA